MKPLQSSSRSSSTVRGAVRHRRAGHTVTEVKRAGRQKGHRAVPWRHGSVDFLPK